MNTAQETREVIISLLKTKKASSNKMLLGLGFNTSMINDMRKGSMPSADKLGYIAEYLEVSVDFLLGRTDNPNINK